MLWVIPALLIVTALGLALAVRSTAIGLKDIERLEQARRDGEILLSLMKDIETGQRGFTATADPLFLEPYDQSLPRIGPALDIMIRNVAGGVPADTIQTLRRLVSRKLDISAQIIAAGRTAPEAARSMVAAGEGKQVMDAIRVQVAAIDDKLATSLAEVRAHVRAWSLWASVLAFGASALACLTAGAFAWLVRRRSVDLLALAEEHRDMAVEAAALGTWEYTRATGTVDASRRTRALFGLPETGPLTLDAFSAMVHADDRGTLERTLRHATADDAVFELEHRIEADDVRWIRTRGRVYGDASGKPAVMRGIVYDMTSTRQTEMALRESLEHHRYSIELNPQVPWTAGPDGAILDFNRRWLELTGMTAEDALGEGWARAPHPDDLPAMAAAWTRSVRTGEPYDVEHRIRLADGNFRWMRSRAFARRDDAGHILRWYGTTEDIHDRKMAELQRAELQAELLHATRISTMGEVASTLAHELNQPLSAVLGYVDGCRVLLETGRLEAVDTVLNALEQTHAQALRAGEIVRRLRQYVVKGQSERRLCDLNALVGEAKDLVLVGTERRGIRITLDFTPDLPPILADPIQIQQVVVNLLRNAVEAMEQGSSRRELTIRTVTADDGGAAAAIIDTGPGLTADVARELFNPFVTTKPTGMGLGLPICRSIIQEHGGWIRSDPNPGGGTVFRFGLPPASSDEAAGDA
jgi:two-component system sensor kinase FixL